MPATHEHTANPRPDITELARLISLHAPYDGVFPLRVPGVDALRRSHTAGKNGVRASTGIPVTVSDLIAMNRPDQLRSHMARARTNGVTQQELVEAITHLAFYSGWPNAVTAGGVAGEVFNAEAPPR